MDVLDLPREVSVEVIYVDEHLMQLEAVAGVGCWRGSSRAYTVPKDISTFAKALHHFVNGGPPAGFVAGEDNGIGLIQLRFYHIDRAKHIACHIRLATGGLNTDHRVEEVSQLAIEVRAEAWAVDQFAGQLKILAHECTGRAVLAIEAGV